MPAYPFVCCLILTCAHVSSQAKRDKRVQYFRRAEKYVNEYRSLSRQKQSLAKIAKKSGQVYVAPEAKVLFVVRIRGYV